MDLNRLYFKHQISMMRVFSAEDAATRGYHQSLADGFAQRIAQFQLGKGANASAAWATVAAQ